MGGVQEALGRQVLSTRPTSAQPRFGTSKRSSMAVKTDSPGPGAYRIKASLGEAPSSRQMQEACAIVGCLSRLLALRLAAVAWQQGTDES